MKKILLTTLLTLAAVCCYAEKSIYIPSGWSYNSSTGEYTQDGYSYSMSRKRESDNFVVFWSSEYGNTAPDALPTSDFFYVNINDLLNQAEQFYKLYAETLKFVDPTKSTTMSKYKCMIMLMHSSEWAAYGGGFDFVVPALWINPGTCKPVGHTIAHEVGHSFHYMCFAEANNHNDSGSINTGFHLSCGKGQAIWEQTAQWQAAMAFPQYMFTESYPLFGYNANYAFSHEWMRYQSYWFHYYLCQYYNDLTTVAQVWKTPMTGQSNGNATDFCQAYIKLKNLTAAQFYERYFDYAMHCATFDFDRAAAYRNNYIGNFRYAATMIADSTYQVAYSSCPQSTGFNVIPLEVKPAGTEITTEFTAMRPRSALTEADPVEYHNGDNWTTSTTKYYNSVSNTSNRGFRLGYVVYKTDGTREYFTDDEIHGTGSGLKTSEISFTVPEKAQRMWLVVVPALRAYVQHKWDDNISNDDQWPYYFKLQGTDIGSNATVYVQSTIDGREVSDIEFEYDVYYAPTTGSDHSGTQFSIGGSALAQLGTAFQMGQPTTDLPACLQAYSSGNPAEGTCKFYALNPTTGRYVAQGYTTNGVGHWFNSSGNRCTYADGYVYSDFTPSTMSFIIGQYPGKLKNGDEYRIGQCIRYKKNNKIATARFYFNIHISTTKTGATLKSITYDDPTTGIENVGADTQTGTTNVYSITGMLLKSRVEQGNVLDGLQPGIYIVGGKKVIKK